MRNISRLAAIGALATLTLSLTACGDDEPAVSSGSTDQATTTPAMPSETAMNDGMTTTDDVFGAGCASIPADATNEGSLDGMVDDPVATAAGNNPLLTKLVAAVQAAGLVDTLNDTGAGYTVFAPYDPAFDALGADALNAVLADTTQLTSILTYHVVPQRMDKDAILDAGTLDTVQGGTVRIGGSGDDVTVNDAAVLCGNIPTANATVFVIDTVLMPTS